MTWIGRYYPLTAALSLLLLTSCAPPPRGPQPLQSFAQQTAPGSAAAVAPAPLALPPDIAQALLPPASGKQAPQTVPRFDVAVDRLEARAFFMGLVEGTPYNMSVHPRVEGEISLALKRVTIPEVMETVTKLYGYRYEAGPSGFQVYPAEMKTELFQVNYLNLSRKGVSQTRVSSGQISETRKDSSSDGNSETLRSAAVSGSQVNTESSSNFWQELEGALKALVGSEAGRQVVVQPQAGVVLVRAFPDELREVGDYLKAIQGNLQRQVILEAKIIEVELNDGFQSGINWALLTRQGDGKNIVFGQTGGGTLFRDGVSELAGKAGTLNPLDPLFGAVDTSAFGGAFSAAVNLKDFTAFIELLQTQGEVQVLSSPRISTVNNQKAVIKVGSDEFFVTDVSATTVTGTTTTTTPEITLTPFFSGIALDVTPQIDADGRVTLHIHPTVSEVVDQPKTITVGGQTQNLPLAFSTIRESDSIVSAESGQVVVIGGLMQNQETKQQGKVPFFGQIPLLGNLFKHQQVKSRKSELVILLRPQVVSGGKAWQADLEQSSGRMNEMGSFMSRPWPGSAIAVPVQP